MTPYVIFFSACFYSSGNMKGEKILLFTPISESLQEIPAIHLMLEKIYGFPVRTERGAEHAEQSQHLKQSFSLLNALQSDHAKLTTISFHTVRQSNQQWALLHNSNELLLPQKNLLGKMQNWNATQFSKTVTKVSHIQMLTKSITALVRAL